jgi:4'-phosphopantetheinyl transferase
MAPGWLWVRSSELPASSEWLSEAEAERCRSLRFAKRRAEWLLGRLAAKRALAALLGLGDEALHELEIRTHPDGFPLPFRRGRPLPVALSLSHRGDVALCAVGGDAWELGCDLELVERRSDAFVSDYLDVQERAGIEARPQDRDWMVPLLWSAKESALKALRLGLSLDAREVGVRALDLEDGATWQRLCVEVAPARRVLEGFWRRRGRHVLTIVGGGGLARPRALGATARRRGVGERPPLRPA